VRIEMKKNTSAFTTAELLISLGIVSIIAAFAITVLTVNFKNAELLRNDSELEFHSQYILNFLSVKVMEAGEIVYIKSGQSSALNYGREVAVDKVAFRYGIDERYCYIFEVRNDKIFYGNGSMNDTANAELGTYVSELKMAPYPEGTKFRDAKAIMVTLVLLKNGRNYEIHQVYYMRGS